MTSPPFLLLHGLGCSVEAWRPMLRRLAERGCDRPAYAVDLPGYGRSGGPSEALGIDELADWTARLLDLLGVARAHVAGNSMGCQVALALARRHPGRVGGLVLAGPTEGGDTVSLARYTLGLLADVVIEPMLYNGTLLRMYLQMGTVRYLATVRRMIEDDPLARAHQVNAPCLIVRGSRDIIVPERAARLLASRLPRGDYVEIPHAPHALQFDVPDALLDLTLPFWQYSEDRSKQAAV